MSPALQAKTAKQIVIDFSKIGEGMVDVDDESNLIQQDALKEAAGCLAKAIVEAVRYRPTISEIAKQNGRSADLARFYETITIHGCRGSGKTTFTNFMLRNVVGDIRRNGGNSDQSELKTQVAERIWNSPDEALQLREKVTLTKLRLIDPTLIETSHNIMVVIISLINEAVEHHEGEVPASLKTAWNDSLRRLSEGLALIDGVRNAASDNDDMADSHAIMTNGLASANSGVNFEKNLHIFIHLSLQLLGSDGFILVFDDVDTSFERGWPVLETLRKYLTSPQMIVVVSGDMDAYSLLVRSHVWQNFGQELLCNEQWNSHARGDNAAIFSRMRQINSQVDRLESQYLLKILKSENRIDLAPLVRYAAHRDDIFITARFSGEEAKEGKTYNIFQCLNELFMQALAIRSDENLHLYRDLILRQPVRTFINLLLGSRAYWTNYDAQARRTHIRDFGLSLALQEAFRNCFSTSLLSVGIVPDDIRGGYVSRLITIVANYLIQNDGWRSLYRLRSDEINDDVNITLIALSSALVRCFDLQPGTVVAYMIRICLVRSSIYLRRYHDLDMSAYMSFLSLSRQESMDQTLGKVLSWKISKSDERGIFNAGRGCISISDKTVAEKLFDRTLTRGTQDIFRIANRIAFLKVIGENGRPYVVYSPLVLLSFVGDLLSSTFADSKDDALKEAARARIREILIRYTSHSGFFMPSRGVTRHGLEDPPVDPDPLSDFTIPSLEREDADGPEFRHVIDILTDWRLAWGKKWQDNVVIRPEAPATFARVWARIMKSAEESEMRGRKHGGSLGAMLDGYIVDLLESVRSEIGESNPKAAAFDTGFDGKPVVDYFCALASCPVWWFFLAPGTARDPKWSGLLDRMHDALRMSERTGDGRFAAFIEAATRPESSRPSIHDYLDGISVNALPQADEQGTMA